VTDDGALFAGPPARRRRLPRDRDRELRPRPVRLPDHDITSARQMIQTLDRAVYHLDDLADAAEQIGLADRDGGRGRRKRGDTVFRHRVRSALDGERRCGRARPLGDAYCVIDGPPHRPSGAVFVFLGRLSDITLAVGAAAEVARRIGEPAALVFCDPPWQRGVGQGRDGREDADWYRRSRSLLIPGYQDVPAGADYYEWSLEWITAAAGVLRPGGHLAVVTGPQESAAVQLAAEHAGLRFTNSVVVPRVNGVAPTRHRFATAHFRLTVMTAAGGTPEFNTIPEMGVDERGRPHPRDVWPPVLPHYARGRLRYPNQLPLPFADQVIRVLSGPGDLVADFFTGAGAVPKICLFRDRRCVASDINPHAVRFTMAAITSIVSARLAEQAQAPPLFGGPGLFPELSPRAGTALPPELYGAILNGSASASPEEFPWMPPPAPPRTCKPPPGS
jgi:DNA modification methylase